MAMKTMMILLLVLFAGSFLIGCNGGMADTVEQRDRRVAAVFDDWARQMTDDSDEFWLIDQNPRLTQWRLWYGN
jgi:hypothetical protein